MIPETMRWADDAEGHEPRWRDGFLWTGVVVQALICIPGMATRTLWLDEAYTAVTSRGSFAAIRAALEHDNGPALHYIMLHLWRAMAGESPLALRIPSLLFVMGTTLLLHRFARITFDGTTARLAVALWVLSPLAVFNANQVRMYGLYTFSAMAVLSTLWPPPREWSWRRVGSLALSAAMLIHTHNAGWFVLAATVIATVDSGPRALLPPRAVIGLAVAAMTYLPWCPVLAAQMANGDRGLWWMERLWSPWNPLLSLASFIPLAKPPEYTGLIGTPGPWWGVVLAAWLLLAAMALVRGDLKRRPSARFLWLVLGLGLALPAIWSVFFRPIYVPGRLDFAVLPIFLLIVAAGLRTLGNAAAGGAMAAAAATSLVVLAGWWTERPQVEERAWVEEITGRARPGDVVLCGPLTLPQAKYYLADRGLSFQAFPTLMEQEPAIFNGYWYMDHIDVAADAALAVERAAAALAPHGRVWVLTAPILGPFHTLLLEQLEASPGLAFEADHEGTRLGLMRIGFRVVVLEFSDRRAAFVEPAAPPTDGSSRQEAPRKP